MNTFLKFNVAHVISQDIHLKSSGEISFNENNFIKSFFGPSGCGKTSLIRILLGLNKGAKCDVQFNEQIWQNSKENIFVPPQQRKIGFVPQKECLFPFLNVSGNITYAIKDWPKDQKQNRLQEILKLFEIENLAERKISEISGGQKQRVSLARAVARPPNLLLLDEPFSALNLNSREILLPRLSEWLHQLKIPSIVVSHDERDAGLLSSQIYPFEGYSLHI